MCCAHRIKEVTKPLVVLGIFSDLVWFLKIRVKSFTLNSFLSLICLIAAISFDISHKGSAVFWIGNTKPVLNTVENGTLQS